MFLFQKIRPFPPQVIQDSTLSVPVIQKEVIIDTHPLTDDEIADPVYLDSCWPSLIHLHVSLYPQPFAPSPVFVQQHLGQKVYAPVDLYHGNSVVDTTCSALGFVYKGEGSAFFETQTLPVFFQNNNFQKNQHYFHFSADDFLYTKPFAHQHPERSTIVQQLVLNAEGQWVCDKDQTLCRLLYPFGGTYVSGLTLESIQPLYFHISSFEEKTTFFTETNQSRFAFLQNPEKTAFKLVQPLRSEEACSAAAALRAGFAQFSLFDEQHNSQKYVSYDFENVIPEQNHYTIYYKKETVC